MQRFFTGRLDGPQCSGKPLEPIGEVHLGETFIIEASLDQEPETLGPVFIQGVKLGDVIAIHINDIQVNMPYPGIDPDYGMIPEILELQRVGKDMLFPITLDDGEKILPGQRFPPCGELVLPGGVRIPIRPMVGSLSLAAGERCPNPWDHGGNMDINEIRKGSTVYIRAQREGGLLALGDLHANQGDGEVSGTGMEASGEVKVTVNVSNKFPAPRPVIEIDNKVMTVGMGLTYWAAVRNAVRDMTYLLMKVLGLSLEAAYCVAVRGNIRNGAIWMMSDHHLITMVDNDYRIPRTVFLELPFGQSSP